MELPQPNDALYQKVAAWQRTLGSYESNVLPFPSTMFNLYCDIFEQYASVCDDLRRIDQILDARIGEWETVPTPGRLESFVSALTLGLYSTRQARVRASIEKEFDHAIERQEMKLQEHDALHGCIRRLERIQPLRSS